MTRTHRSIALVLLGIILIGLMAEAGARFALGRMSRIQRRIDQEYRSSLALPRNTPAGKPTMLLLGNSLLLEGVDFDSLRSALAPRYDVHRLVIEQTNYVDLYYILQTVFRQGSRPHDVVLCLSVGQVIADDMRGEFTARYLDSAVVPSLARREHFDATTTTNYFFAHWSAWFGTRVELRKWLLGQIMPDVVNMTVVLGARPASNIPVSEVLLRSGPRLKELKALCDRYGSRCTILIPPTLTEDHAEDLAALGREIGIRVLVPVGAGRMDKSEFRDGFHLAPAGAAIFTAKLDSEL